MSPTNGHKKDRIMAMHDPNTNSDGMTLRHLIMSKSIHIYLERITHVDRPTIFTKIYHQINNLIT